MYLQAAYELQQACIASPDSAMDHTLSGNSLRTLALPPSMVCQRPQQTLRTVCSLCHSYSECLVQNLEESAVDIRAVARSPPLPRDITKVKPGRSLHGLLHPEGVLRAVPFGSTVSDLPPVSTCYQLLVSL